MRPLDYTRLRIRPLALCAMLALIAGCQSAAYRAGNLPNEFRTVATKTNQKIDLAQIAAPGASSAILAPGDLLEVTVSTSRDDEKVSPALVRIADDGTVDVPVIGPVPVAGVEAFKASQNITNLAIERGMYRHPLVTVEIKSKAVNRITVLGAVAEPGVHELPRGSCDLVSALAAAGGLGDDADSKIEIIRQPRFGLSSQSPTSSINAAGGTGEVQLAGYQSAGGGAAQNPQHQVPQWLPTQTLQLDLEAAKPNSPADYRLQDRDIVRVMPRKKEVIHVAGLVKKPGQFELPLEQEIHLLDAIAMAGGRSSNVADKILVIRHLKNQSQPVVIQASISKAKQDGLENLRIGPGDMISIEQTPATAVVDAFAKFFRLSFGVASNTVF